MPARRTLPSAAPSPQHQSSYESKFDLTSMFEFSNIVNSSLDTRFILGHLLLTIMGKLLALRGIVLLKTGSDVFRVENAKGFSQRLEGTELIIPRVPRRLTSTDKEDGRKHPWLRFFRDLGIHLIAPLTVRDTVVGIAGFSPSISKKKLGAREETYLKSLSNVAAGAIEKGLVLDEMRQLNRRLDGKFQELNTLFELGKEFNALLDVERIVKLLVFSIIGQVGAMKYLLCLERQGRMEVVSSRLDASVPPELLKSVQTLSSPRLVESLTSRQERTLRSSLEELKMSVLIPLRMQNRTTGALAVGEKIRDEKYTQADLEFLSSLGNLAMISLENARLFKDALEKQKLEDELLIAREIQQGLLPKSLPSISRFDVAALNISSKQVGGDYYDVLPVGGEQCVIAIGDVSGKGTPASLLMANLQATIRALVPTGLPLAELTKRVNDLLCESTSSGRFVTFFWAVVDSNDRSVRYVSAGHNPPFLIRSDGQTERLDKGGIILGVMKTILPYEEGRIVMNDGDVLVLFTDGVSEAMNARGEELGEQSLEDAIKREVTSPAETILTSIVEAVRQHSQQTPQSDDITIVVLKAKV